VKTHTIIGATILAETQMQLFRVAEVIARHHHENWNGTGYTPGLTGDAIPLVARIVRVSDVYDSMTLSRPWAETWRREAAVEFIQGQSGLTFDPLVVNAFSKVVNSTLDAVIA
jgi:putative two-component system response regulator